MPHMHSQAAESAACHVCIASLLEFQSGVFCQWFGSRGQLEVALVALDGTSVFALRCSCIFGFHDLHKAQQSRSEEYGMSPAKPREKQTEKHAQ